MKIALFHNLPSGGAKRAVMEWTRRLSDRHDIRAYSISTADQAFCDIRPYVKSHAEYRFTPSHLFRRPAGRLNQLQRWRDLGRLTRLYRDLARAIDAGSCDVLFAHPCAVTQVPPLLTFVRTPAIYYLHEPVGDAAPPLGAAMGPPSAGWRRRLDDVDPLIRLFRARLRRLHRAGIKTATRLLANSDFTRRAVASAYGVNAHVAPCGVDAEVFRPLPGGQRGRHVLSVGECSPRKGFGFLVEALARLPEGVRPALRLACNVVDEAERRRVETLAAERRVQLTILRRLTTEQLVNEYNAAAACVYAPIGEPFGLVVLEAMACGLAVVAVGEGGVTESVVHGATGLLVSREPQAFADALGSLLARPERAAAFGRLGRVAVERQWSWDRSCGVIERHLEDTAQRGRRCGSSPGGASAVARSGRSLEGVG